MTWNPRDVAHPTGTHQIERHGGFQLPEAPVPGSGTGNPVPYLPTATPTVAEAMGWGSGEEMGNHLPPDVVQELVYEGICPDTTWDRWKSLVMRGHYE